MKKKKRKKDYY